MPQNPEEKPSLAKNDKNLLKYFFWFSLALSLLLLFAMPSVTTIGIVFSVVALGTPLFKKPQAPEETDKHESSASPYAVRISKGWGLFLAASTFGMPFVFGWTPAKDAILFFILAFFGLTIGSIIFAVVKLSSQPANIKRGNDANP